MTEDTFKTIKEISEGIYKEKGSRFLAFAYPINTEEEFKEIQKVITKKFHDARHRCFAYQIGTSNVKYRSSDDGEPSNTAGKPILGQIHSHELTNILIFVVRYFGGTLLGVGGLINAYRSAAANAIEKADIITKTIDHTYQLNFNYTDMNSVMKILKDNNIRQFDHEYDNRCTLKFIIRQRDMKKVLGLLYKIHNIELENIN